MSKNSLLWSVQKGEGQPLLYLFGTMHASDQRVTQLLGKVKHYIDASQRFATEYELSENDFDALDEALLLPEGKQLSDYFSKQNYRKLSRLVAEQLQADIALFSERKPLVLSNQLTETLFQKTGLLPLDQLLSNYAEQQGKELLGIERFAEQLATLKAMPLEEQAKPLKEAARNFRKFRKSFEKNMQLYLQQDIRKLYKSVKRSSGALRKPLLYDRNILMAERLQAWVEDEQGTVFAALGAAHLWGKTGVLRLLKQAGYRTKPLRMSLLEENE